MLKKAEGTPGTKVLVTGSLVAFRRLGHGRENLGNPSGALLREAQTDWARWCTPIIPGLSRQRQVDL